MIVYLNGKITSNRSVSVILQVLHFIIFSRAHFPNYAIL